ncbi:MAG: tRNA preQ1(34) S-adenosylmethionine ribosyltransferase-isomerase QueA [bacterium]|nr:tRNA preQ1(34) S-adenosylmethionine ribosyltransferase-isomerase QueA [bacterium]
MLVADFDYKSPKELIAQYPPKERGSSKLLVLHRTTGKIEHRMFHNIIEYLGSGDTLVLNETKVIKARLIGKRVDTGGKVEIFLLRPLGSDDSKNPVEWEVLISPARAKKVGVKVEFGPNFGGEIKSVGEHHIFKFYYSGDFLNLLDKYGIVPLPPYIKRAPIPDDYFRYQTVYATVPGACAAPTAGLHFTQFILDKLIEQGVEVAKLVLHTGLGSFKPIKSDKVESHQMEPEYYEITVDTIDKIRLAKRVVAVGTTTVRALESLGEVASSLQDYKGWTNKFIYPPYEFKWVDALITNFHLPKSTPLLLVCAFVGRDLIFKAYNEAINCGYKFYSYGDAMLII